MSECKCWKGQPIENGRFVPNKIVEWMADEIGLNRLSATFNGDEHLADWEQLYQLIGYSLNGYADLSRVSDESYYSAVRESERGKGDE
jgi:hypothetical protein